MTFNIRYSDLLSTLKMLETLDIYGLLMLLIFLLSL